MRARVAGITGNAAAAGGYLHLAESIATPPPPQLTITFGLSGSGKTTAGADFLGAHPSATTLRLRSDVERRRLFGLAPLAHSQSMVDGSIYTPEATLRTYARLVEAAGLILDAGWSVILDAAFLKRSERDDFRALAAARGARFAILACTAPVDELQRRLLARHGDASEATVEVLEKQLGWMEPLGSDETERVITPLK